MAFNRNRNRNGSGRPSFHNNKRKQSDRDGSTGSTSSTTTSAGNANGSKKPKFGQNGNGKAKYGRKQLRLITRLGRRNNAESFGQDDDELDFDAAANGGDVDSGDEINGAAGDDDDDDEDSSIGNENDPREAYNALMVLLNADQQKKQQKKNKSKLSEEEELLLLEEEEEQRLANAGKKDQKSQLQRSLIDEKQGGLAKAAGEDGEDGDEEEGSFGIEEADEEEEAANTKQEDQEDAQDYNADAEEAEELEGEGNGGLASDPFEYHITNPKEESIDGLDELLQANPRAKWETSRENLRDESYVKLEQLPPNNFRLAALPQSAASTRKLSDFKIKSKALAAFEKLQQQQEQEEEDLNSLQKLILDPVFNYKDLVLPYQSYSNESSLRDIYCLHAVNHILKTRDRILKNNLKLSSFKEQLEQGQAQLSDEPELRDQSFNRPKVLVLLPTRKACYEVVSKIIKISDLLTVENKKKFMTQYYSEDTVPEYKPDDFKYLFNGNSNDFFCMGVKFTRKTLKLYSAFGQSDIILASPLGLKTILEKKDARSINAKKNNSNDSKSKEFLSSIEVLIVDQANSLQWQNWANVSYVLRHVNKIPQHYSDDLDFSRIKMWAINNRFKYIRQNLVFAKFLTPEINNLINANHSLNMSGKVKFKKDFLSTDGKKYGESTGSSQTSAAPAISQIVFKVKQTFSRFDSEVPSSDPDTRFNFFKTLIVPLLMEQTEEHGEPGGTLVYVPDYSDYLRLKQYLRFETSVNFCAIDEYASQSKLTRYRDGFKNGKYKVMLYTERLHHYNRFEIQGVKNVVFYKVPSEEKYYTEVVLRFLGHSMMKEVIKDIGLSYVRVLYSKWDALMLEKIVGTEKAPVLCYGANEIYQFK